MQSYIIGVYAELCHLKAESQINDSKARMQTHYFSNNSV